MTPRVNVVKSARKCGEIQYFPIFPNIRLYFSTSSDAFQYLLIFSNIFIISQYFLIFPTPSCLSALEFKEILRFRGFLLIIFAYFPIFIAYFPIFFPRFRGISPHFHGIFMHFHRIFPCYRGISAHCA